MLPWFFTVIDHRKHHNRGMSISDTLGCASCATFLFSPHFDFICDFLLNRRRATWKLRSIECSLLMCCDPLVKIISKLFSPFQSVQNSWLT